MNKTKKIISTLLSLSIASVYFGAVFAAEETGILSVTVSNGEESENIDFETPIAEYTRTIDFSQDVVVTVAQPSETAKVYFGCIENNKGTVSEVADEDYTYSVQLDENSLGSRVVIKVVDGADEDIYSILFGDDRVRVPDIKDDKYGSSYFNVTVTGFNSSFLNAEETISLNKGEWKDSEETHSNFADFETQNVKEKELVKYYDLQLFNESNEPVSQPSDPLPVNILFERPNSSGIMDFGKDVRIYNISDEGSELVWSEDDGYEMEFCSDRYGIFAVVYNPYAFSAVFYSDEIETEDGGTEYVLYHEITDILKTEKELDIKKPEKEGYEFARWSTFPGGRGAPLYEGGNIAGEWYAVWETKEDYDPLVITLTAQENIDKGSEDGKVIDVSVSDGVFMEYSQYWDDMWSVEGCSGVTIGNIERIDDQNVQITLSGNSSSASFDSYIKVMFESDLLYTEKVQINEAGAVRKTLVSDNSITVKGIEKEEDKPSRGRPRATIDINNETKVKAPSASIESGEVAKGTFVELKGEGTIYYTLDGSEPTENSLLYSAPISIEKDTEIKFVAVKDGKKSSVSTASYTVKEVSKKMKDNASEIRFIKNRSGNNFEPDLDMTRYEVLESLSCLFNIEDAEYENTFTDVDEEYKELVNLFAGAGVIKGYNDNTFKGEKGISRAEFVTILCDLLNVGIQENTDTEFSDMENHWAKDYVNAFSKTGYVLGYPDGTFKPDENVTRAEAVSIINRITDNSLEPLENIPEDITSEYWAYDDILKALQ